MQSLISLLLSFLKPENDSNNNEINEVKVREIRQDDDVKKICALIKSCRREDYFKCCFKSVTSIQCQVIIIGVSAYVGTYFYGQYHEIKGALLSIFWYVILCIVLEFCFEQHHREYLNTMAESFEQEGFRYKQNECYKMWIAIETGNEEIIGCIALKPISNNMFPSIKQRKDYLQVLYLRTDSRYRRKGVATSLYTSLLTYAKNRKDIKTLILNTAPLYMDTASIFYKHRGFKVDRFNTYYHGPHKLLNCDMYTDIR